MCVSCSSFLHRRFAYFSHYIIYILSEREKYIDREYVPIRARGTGTKCSIPTELLCMSHYRMCCLDFSMHPHVYTIRLHDASVRPYLTYFPVEQTKKLTRVHIASRPSIRKTLLFQVVVNSFHFMYIMGPFARIYICICIYVYIYIYISLVPSAFL